jgi:hypothetical protein
MLQILPRIWNRRKKNALDFLLRKSRRLYLELPAWTTGRAAMGDFDCKFADTFRKIDHQVGKTGGKFSAGENLYPGQVKTIFRWLIRGYGTQGAFYELHSSLIIRTSFITFL